MAELWSVQTFAPVGWVGKRKLLKNTMGIYRSNIPFLPNNPGTFPSFATLH